MTPPLWQKTKKNTFLMKVKEESGKVGVKLNIKKTKIMAPSPITSWQRDGTMETVAIFLVSKTTADGDCSHKIKRLLGRKPMTNLDSILQSRDVEGRSQDGRGIGRGDHFLSYKFIKRITDLQNKLHKTASDR